MRQWYSAQSIVDGIKGWLVDKTITSDSSGTTYNNNVDNRKQFAADILNYIEAAQDQLNARSPFHR